MEPSEQQKLQAERPAFDDHTLAEVMESVADQLADTTGELVLEFVFNDGRLRRSYVRHGPLASHQLEARRSRDGR